MFRRCIVCFGILLMVVVGAGCELKKFGRVDQGRAIAFDKDKWTMTMIRDQSTTPGKPDYAYLPPITYALPTDHNEMGPDPKVGMRMKLDAQKREIVAFIPTLQSFATIHYTLVDEKEGIDERNPLVFDGVEGKAKKFPIVDKIKKTITIYSKRQKLLTTFSVPDEYFALPENTWDAGDEMRVFYQKEGIALRVMNVTRTDIFKK